MMFTSVALNKALTIVHNKLVQDQGLPMRTILTIQHTTEIL